MCVRLPDSLADEHRSMRWMNKLKYYKYFWNSEKNKNIRKENQTDDENVYVFFAF